jgi:hypothetical protein
MSAEGTCCAWTHCHPFGVVFGVANLSAVVLLKAASQKSDMSPNC